MYMRLVSRLSAGRVIHGVEVRVFGSEHPDDQVFAKMDAALNLLAAYSPLHVSRLRRYARIQIAGTEGPRAEWYEEERIIKLLERYVTSENTAVEHIAASIVHELSHGRLDHGGVAYMPGRRQRIEAICINSQARFAMRLPGGEELAAYYRKWARTIQEQPDEEWSDAAFVGGRVATLEKLDAPEWIIRWARRRQQRMRAIEVSRITE
jgi:hypothetical protein